jgi:hypothetical protein
MRRKARFGRGDVRNRNRITTALAFNFPNAPPIKCSHDNETIFIRAVSIRHNNCYIEQSKKVDPFKAASVRIGAEKFVDEPHRIGDWSVS